MKPTLLDRPLPGDRLLQVFAAFSLLLRAVAKSPDLESSRVSRS